MTFDYLIFAGGRLPDLKFTKRLIKISKSIITVDRGATLALKLKIKPQLHVGDGDSFSSLKLKKLKACAVIKLPQQKSLSDLEFTLNHLDPLRTKLVIGAHGDFEGRPDHGFLNLLLLSRTPNLYFADEKTWVTSLTPKKIFSFSVRRNSVFSVANMGLKSLKITISGSAYDAKSKIFSHTTQGLSNLTRSKWTRIKTSGQALLFVSSNLIHTIIDAPSLI